MRVLPQHDPFFRSCGVARIARPLDAGTAAAVRAGWLFHDKFHDVARGAKFEYTDLEVEIEGSVRRSRSNGCSFTEILIRPRLTVPVEDQREPGLALLRRTKALCMISRAVTAPQTLEPIVEAVRVPVEGWSDHEAAVKLGV